jgi:hypothetical protein
LFKRKALSGSASEENKMTPNVFYHSTGGRRVSGVEGLDRNPSHPPWPKGKRNTPLKALGERIYGALVSDRVRSLYGHNIYRIYSRKESWSAEGGKDVESTLRIAFPRGAESSVSQHD